MKRCKRHTNNMTSTAYILTRRKMQSIRIRVLPPYGEVRVSAPLRVPLTVIDNFVAEKKVWINQQQERISALPRLPQLDPIACKATLNEKVPGLIDYWQGRLGVECTGWKTRKMRTRWGSCNIRTRGINLNLELGRLDERLLEYVVVHELVHLHERYHNEHFYAWLEKMLPDWRQREAELRAVPLC